MGAGARFRVVLNALGVMAIVAKAFDGTVVQVGLGNSNALRESFVGGASAQRRHLRGSAAEVERAECDGARANVASCAATIRGPTSSAIWRYASRR